MDLSKIKPLITEKDIQRRVKELADELNRTYSNHSRVYIIGILRGCFIFLSDLVRHLTFPLVIDFISVGSYGKSLESSGVVKIIEDLNVSLSGETVIVVEDIIDTRLSLSAVDKILRARKPRELRYCALLDKPSRKQVEFEVDWLGFTIPDEFVVGYGLDASERYRNLKFIGVLADD